MNREMHQPRDKNRLLKIDVHHHIFASSMMSAKLEKNKEVGFRTPPENLPWSLAKSLVLMDDLGIAAAVLSYPAGVPEKVSMLL